MSTKRERDGLRRLIKGSAGHFVLNQKTQVFEDRRTRRARDRSTKNRRAIDDQMA